MAWSNLKTVKTYVCGASLLAALASTGCQSDYAGQTLPSPYWHTDDIQYFPPGTEFKLPREAAALKRKAQAVRADRSPDRSGPPTWRRARSGYARWRRRCRGQVHHRRAPHRPTRTFPRMPAEGALPPEDAAPGADPFNNP